MLQSPVMVKARIYQKYITKSKNIFIQLEIGVKNELSHYLLFKIYFQCYVED